MEIELKKITFNARLSEDSNCFSADLWIDGKKIGEVGNEGFGGPDFFRGDRAAYDKADAWCKANLPSDTYEGITIETDLEIKYNDILVQTLIARDVKRLLKSKVLCYHEGRPGIYQYKWKGVKAVGPAHIASVRKDHPKAIILNELPLDKAVEIYRKHG